MIEKAIKGIVDKWTEELLRLEVQVGDVGRHAATAVARAKDDIAALLKMAEDVNVKTLERFQGMLTTDFQVYKSENGAPPFFSLQVGHGGYHELRGVLGPEIQEAGKYRALVLIERVGPGEWQR
jgi:hypothetical protein